MRSTACSIGSRRIPRSARGSSRTRARPSATWTSPTPSARRCFALGQHIARVVAKSPWNVGIIATGGLSHFPELSVPRIGETDTVFDQKLIHWMERGEHEPLEELSADELHKSGGHEFLD